MEDDGVQNSEGIPLDQPPQDERTERVRRIALRVVASILLLAFLLYALNSFLQAFIMGDRPGRQPTPTPVPNLDYEAVSPNAAANLRARVGVALPTPYPPPWGRARAFIPEQPAWHPAPEEYTVIDQLAWDVAFGYDLDTKGCGPVAATSALVDLGYPDAELGICLPTIRNAAGGLYSPTYGIQPSDFCVVVEAVVENGYLGATGEVECVQADGPVAGLLAINQALADGNAVVVDLLITTDKSLAGTYLIGEERQPPDPEQPLAHFTRLLGFADDGRTVVLAELLHPNAYNNAAVLRVPSGAFFEAWREPELRARYKPANVEDVSYWMMVISPPLEVGR